MNRNGYFRYVLVLLAGLTLSAADEITGTWKTVMVNSSGGRPLVNYEPTFEFKVDGNKLTGAAHMDDWPGDAPISDGKVEGSRIMFTVVHERTYSSGLTGTHHPEFKCEGTIHGNEMDLTMVSIDEEGRKYEMKGTRISK